MTLTEPEDRIVRRGTRTCPLVEGRPSFFVGKTLNDFVVLTVKRKILIRGITGLIRDDPRYVRHRRLTIYLPERKIWGIFGLPSQPDQGIPAFQHVLRLRDSQKSVGDSVSRYV